MRFHANAYFNLIELVAAGGDELAVTAEARDRKETRFLLAALPLRPPLIEQQGISPPPANQVAIPDLAGGDPTPSRTYRWRSSTGRERISCGSARHFSLQVVWSLDQLHAGHPGLFWRPPGIDFTLPAGLAQHLGLAAG